MNLDIFTFQNKFLMLALDHRGSFKKLINPESPDAVTNEEASKLKKEIIESLADQFSGLLIDVDYGLLAYQDKVKPFLLPLEKSGYTENLGERVTELERTAEELKNLGASGAKLLLYFNPHLVSATQQIETAKKALEQCKSIDFPLFLEIVTYEVGGKEEDREELVLRSLDILLEEHIKPDVYKLEYPGNAAACSEITKKLGDIPWIILTRGESFDSFKVQLKEAIYGGAKGFLAGRALWKEVCQLEGEEKDKFLRKTLSERFKILSDIAGG